MMSIKINLSRSSRQIFSICFFAITLFLFAVLAKAQVTEKTNQLPANQQVNSADLLKLNQLAERQIKGGEIHSFQFDVKAGFYARAEVEQKNIDVIVSLFAPDGKFVVEMDGKDGRLWREAVSAIAEKSGLYRVEIKAYGAADKSGSYTLKLTENRQSVPSDSKRLKAETHLSAGRKFFGQSKYQEAAKEYETAIELWRELNDVQWEAVSLVNLGLTYSNLSKNEPAISAHTQATELFQKTKDRIGESKSLHGLGNVFFIISQYEKARESYEKALTIRREIKDRQGESAMLNNLGNVYDNLAQYEKAKDYFEQALVISREIKDRRGEGAMLNNLGIIYDKLAQYEKAKDYYEQSLVIRREVKDRRSEGSTLMNLGIIYGTLAQYEKARDYFEQALVISREIKDRYDEGATLMNLGNVYRNLAQYEKAKDYFEQALVISREIKDRRGEGLTLNNLGIIYDKLAQYEKAKDYFEQALVISREIKDRQGEGETLMNLGNVYRNLAQYEKAKDYYLNALKLNRYIGEISNVALTLANIARLESDQGNLSEARSRIEESLTISESIRTKIVNQELRSSFFATVKDYYDLYIDILMRQHKEHPSDNFNALALQAAERSRSRSLLEILTEARADIRQGVDAQLLERERNLQRQLNATAKRQAEMFSGEHTAEQAAAIKKDLDDLTNQYQRVETQIRQSSPRYAALTQPQPLSVKEIQTQVLDSDTVLLEYSLGEDKSYLWAVTTTSITSYELPKRAEIETAARRFYELLTARNRRSSSVKDETDAQKQARVEKDNASINQDDAQLPEAAALLSRLVLLPVAEQLGTKRLVIVADGALQYVPFAALPEPALAKNASSLSQPLVIKHEIISLPSASTVAVLRREMAGRAPAPKTVAVVADPVFSKDDVRVDEAVATNRRNPGNSQTRKTKLAPDSASSSIPPTSVLRSLKETGITRDGLGLSRLTKTREEANNILALVPARAGIKAINFEASRATVESGELAQYRIVHFATHGLLNSEHPELSGIVLSLVNERGEPQDGFIRLHEIYNLKLPAELVVLSACQTALGKEIRGEGLVGLTRGFMYAGAPRVVASLWQVDDAATRELMERFYRAMLMDKLRPAAALRRAQIGMAKQITMGKPYNWAAFVLQGEWK